MLTTTAFVEAITGVHTGGIGAAYELDEKIRAAGELEGAGDHQEPGDLDQAPQPRGTARAVVGAR